MSGGVAGRQGGGQRLHPALLLHQECLDRGGELLMGLEQECIHFYPAGCANSLSHRIGCHRLPPYGVNLMNWHRAAAVSSLRVAAEFPDKVDDVGRCDVWLFQRH